MRRRTFLARAGALTVGTAALGSNVDAADDSAGSRSTSTLLPGTEHATPIVTVDAPKSGPTALVTGGIHGNEPAGWRAAEAVADWSFDRGRVVVLPRANRVAIERRTRHGTGGDLNRKFPPGQRPTTKLARAIWGLVEETDPDVVLDLHASKGIYETHAEFVGQAVFPTDIDPAPAHAETAIGRVNESTVPWYLPLHEYRRGNLLTGESPSQSLLVHKVAGDLGLPGYIVETTKFLVDGRMGGRWNADFGEQLLSLHGIHRQGGASA